MPQVRISVANLAPYLKNASTGQVVAIGILDERSLREKGVVRYMAVGGAAKMLPNKKAFLGGRYGASFQDDDARFVVDDQHLAVMIDHFTDKDYPMCERSVLREFIEELVLEPVQGRTVLTAEQAALCTEEFLSTVLQAVSRDQIGTSLEARAHGVPTRRIFNLFEVTAPDEVFMEIVASRLITCFLPRELDTTKLGECAGKTIEGYQMADNLCNWFPDRW